MFSPVRGIRIFFGSIVGMIFLMFIAKEFCFGLAVTFGKVLQLCFLTFIKEKIGLTFSDSVWMLQVFS